MADFEHLKVNNNKIVNSAILKYLRSLIVFIFITSISIAQPTAKIKIVSWVKNGSVILRWAPDNAIAWDEANKSGYKIVRTTYSNDKKVKNTPVNITHSPIKVRPMKEWAAIINNEEFAPIAAQAIFGQTFEISNPNGGIAQWINKSKETENRYGFALYSADQSPVLASYMGLYFKDSTIKSNEKYIYKVFSVNTNTGISIDTGYILVDGSRIDMMKAPQPPAISSDVKHINLSWNAELYQNIFSSWMLERSDDGGVTFKQLTKKPIVYVKNKNRIESYIFWSDSVSKTGYNYYYRLKGRNIFGLVSPPSTTVAGFAKPNFSENPIILKVVPMGNTKAKVEWKFNPKSNGSIRSFTISIASKDDGIYKVVETVDSTKREGFIDCPYPSNYIKVTVINRYGDALSSFSKLYQPDDRVPPTIPDRIKWKCDTAGRVVLWWNKNKEADLLGYRIFRSNGPNLEFTNITSEIKSDTFFVDSVSAPTLTKKFYYKIISMDVRLNKSGYSPLIIVKKPDRRPPTAPVFVALNATDSCIYLKWEGSKSNDVVMHSLLRSNNPTGDFKSIFNISIVSTVAGYADKNIVLGENYYYKIVAIDEDSNVSIATQVAQLKLIDGGVREEIKNIKSEVDRDSKVVTLTWKYKTENIFSFQVYRNEKYKPPVLYKTVNVNKFEDTNLSINTIYYYRLKAVFKDGGSSPLSKPIEVNY